MLYLCIKSLSYVFLAPFRVKPCAAELHQETHNTLCLQILSKVMPPGWWFTK